MNNKQGKIWGNTKPLFNKNNVEIHRIEVDSGGATKAKFIKCTPEHWVTCRGEGTEHQAEW